MYCYWCYVLSITLCTVIGVVTGITVCTVIGVMY